MKTTSLSKLAVSSIKNLSLMSEAFDAAHLEIIEYQNLTANQTQTIAKQGDEIKELKDNLQTMTKWGQKFKDENTSLIGDVRKLQVKTLEQAKKLNKKVSKKKT